MNKEQLEQLVEEEEQAHSTPAVETLEGELERERYRSRFRSVLQNTIFVLIVVAAGAVLVATLWMPVLQIYGSSMEPSLSAGDVVVCVKSENFSRGDVIAFYYNNKILVKRVIALEGDQVSIAEDGTVSVNGEVLTEPYVKRLALGQCNITMPYQVPENRMFVIGDDREGSVDSRNSAVGSVDGDQVVGKLLFRVWPGRAIGRIR